jgi:hypothetical protein
MTDRLPTHSRDDAQVAAATPADLAYVVDLAKRHAHALGFVARAALARKIELARVDLARENGQPCGFLHHGSFANKRTPGEARIFQACVQYDAQRRHHGLNLVERFLAKAEAAGTRRVSLRCLSDLDANQFWPLAGFERLGTEPGRKGELIVWGKQLADDAGNFLTRWHPCPRCGIRTVDTWTAGPRRWTTCPACTRHHLEDGR